MCFHICGTSLYSVLCYIYGIRHQCNIKCDMKKVIHGTKSEIIHFNSELEQFDFTPINGNELKVKSAQRDLQQSVFTQVKQDFMNKINSKKRLEQLNAHTTQTRTTKQKTKCTTLGWQECIFIQIRHVQEKQQWKEVRDQEECNNTPVRHTKRNRRGEELMT